MSITIRAVKSQMSCSQRILGDSVSRAMPRLSTARRGAVTRRFRRDSESVGCRIGMMLGRNKSPLGGVLRAAERDPMEEAKEAAMSANELPEGVTADDLRKFYTLVDSKTWEEVQEKAIELVQTGELTEGVVKAGEAVLTEATKRKEDPRILGSLEDAVGLLSSAMAIVKAPPGLRLADECSNAIIEKGSVEAAKPTVTEMLKAAFDDPSVEITPQSLLGDVEGFLANIESQEEQSKQLLATMKEQAASAEEITQMIEFGSQRERAKNNLIALRNIVNDM